MTSVKPKKLEKPNQKFRAFVASKHLTLKQVEEIVRRRVPPGVSGSELTKIHCGDKSGRYALLTVAKAFRLRHTYFFDDEKPR